MKGPAQGKHAGEKIHIQLRKELSALNDGSGSCLKVRQAKEMLFDLPFFIKLLKKPELRMLGS